MADLEEELLLLAENDEEGSGLGGGEEALIIPEDLGDSSSSTLIWSLDETKRMFKTERLWPSFIGAKKEVPYYASTKQQQKANAGLLPVLLWKEQEQYLVQKRAAAVVVAAAAAAGAGAGAAEAERGGAAAGGGGIERRKRKHAETQDNDHQVQEGEEEEEKEEQKGEDQDDEEQPTKRARPQSYAPFGIGLGLGAAMNKIGSFFASIASSTVAAITSVARGTAFLPYSPEWDPAKFSKICNLPKEQQQLIVFTACQEKQYFIGPGDVYGGDYNIYRGGDPSNSHSTATIRVVRKRTITARDLLSYSRVQNQVAKSAVLAFVDPDTHNPGFLVVNFSNVSERL